MVGENIHWMRYADQVKPIYLELPKGVVFDLANIENILSDHNIMATSVISSDTSITFDCVDLKNGATFRVDFFKDCACFYIDNEETYESIKRLVDKWLSIKQIDEGGNNSE